TAVDRCVVCGEIHAGSEPLGVDRIPVVGAVNLLGFGHGDVADRLRGLALALEPCVVHGLGDAVHGFAAGIGGMVAPSAFPFGSNGVALFEISSSHSSTVNVLLDLQFFAKSNTKSKITCLCYWFCGSSSDRPDSRPPIVAAKSLFSC